MYNVENKESSMKIGFTGTKEGMTKQQRTTLIEYLEQRQDEITEVHHGDCIGADTQFHELVQRLLPKARIVVHPPIDESRRAFCSLREDDPTSRKPKSYLDRNTDIARECDELVACPKEGTEVIRSGTWSTVRRARKLGRLVTIIAPP